MKNIIYLKNVKNYEKLLTDKLKKMPVFAKKIIFKIYSFLKIISKRNLNGLEIWDLPIENIQNEKEVIKAIKKLQKYKDCIFVLSKDLNIRKVHKLFATLNVGYLEPSISKKVLLFEALKYINKVQGLKLDEMELTILVNNSSNLNVHLIEELSHKVRNIKIVSKNIYKFKKIEEKLYNEYGIAVQFSNSYRRSLLKSKIIVNFDFSQTDIDEYVINDRAMIINCTCNSIKVKSKLFNGIVVNSYKLKIKNILLLDEFEDLLIYESRILAKNNINEIFEEAEENKASIIGFIGNNGAITKKELKSLFLKK